MAMGLVVLRPFLRRWYHVPMNIRYVDAEKGRDSNPGTSPDRAWKTLRRATARQLAPGDTLLLRRGCVWTEPLRLAGSGTPAKPITIGAYGQGPRPRLAVRDRHVVTNDGPVSWWRITRLDIAGAAALDPYGRTSGAQGGIIFRQSEPSIGLVVEDCVVHDVAGAGIAFWAGRVPGTVYTGWTVTGCEVYHAGTGITCGGPWPPGSDPWRFHEGLTVRDCRVHDIGTDGIVLSHCRDGVIEHCTVWRTGIGRTKRTPVGVWFFQAQRCVIQFCESFDNHTAGGHADGGGFDLDGGAVDCVMQYNYSHDNDGAGYLVCSYDPKDAPCVNCTTRFNLSVNDGRANDYGSILFWQAYYCRTYNNTCITRVASPLRFTSDTWGNLFANNLFVVDAKTDIPAVKSSFGIDRNEFKNNLYWRTGGRVRFEVQEARKLDFRGFEKLVRGSGERTGDPRLTAMAGREIDLPAGSPLRRAGLRLPEMGLVDFDGRTLPKSGPVPLGSSVR